MIQAQVDGGHPIPSDDTKHDGNVPNEVTDAKADQQGGLGGSEINANASLPSSNKK